MRNYSSYVIKLTEESGYWSGKNGDDGRRATYSIDNAVQFARESDAKKLVVTPETETVVRVRNCGWCSQWFEVPVTKDESDEVIVCEECVKEHTRDVE